MKIKHNRLKNKIKENTFERARESQNKNKNNNNNEKEKRELEIVAKRCFKIQR